MLSKAHTVQFSKHRGVKRTHTVREKCSQHVTEAQDYVLTLYGLIVRHNLRVLTVCVKWKDRYTIARNFSFEKSHTETQSLRKFNFNNG